MRTRRTSYKDYGISDEEVEYIIKFCLNSNDEEKELIKEALSKLNPYISPIIFQSLVSKKSYEKLCQKDYLYIGKEDFYGYRRLGIYHIKDWLKLHNRWKY